jgi:hypothetical protein
MAKIQAHDVWMKSEREKRRWRLRPLWKFLFMRERKGGGGYAHCGKFCLLKENVANGKCRPKNAST